MKIYEVYFCITDTRTNKKYKSRISSFEDSSEATKLFDEYNEQVGLNATPDALHVKINDISENFTTTIIIPREKFVRDCIIKVYLHTCEKVN